MSKQDDEKEFLKRLALGFEAQEILIEYFWKTHKLKHVGGDRNGSICNQLDIEKINDCEYIHTNTLKKILKRNHGPMLKFYGNYEGSTVLATMPDEFFFDHKHNTHMWVEVKTTKHDQKSDLRIKKYVFEDYLEVQKIAGYEVYVTFVMPVYGCEEFRAFDFYMEKVSVLDDCKNGNLFQGEYYWDVRECFQKINKKEYTIWS